MWAHEDVAALKDCPPVCRVREGGFAIQESPPVLAGGFFHFTRTTQNHSPGMY